jgi:hypothetical protein
MDMGCGLLLVTVRFWMDVSIIGRLHHHLAIFARGQSQKSLDVYQYPGTESNNTGT